MNTLSVILRLFINIIPHLVRTFQCIYTLQLRRVSSLCLWMEAFIFYLCVFDGISFVNKVLKKNVSEKTILISFIRFAKSFLVISHTCSLHKNNIYVCK